MTSLIDKTLEFKSLLANRDNLYVIDNNGDFVVDNDGNSVIVGGAPGALDALESIFDKQIGHISKFAKILYKKSLIDKEVE